MRDNPVLQSTWMLVAALCFTALAAVIKVAADTYSIYEIIFYRSVFGIFATFWMLRRLGISINTSYPGLFFLRCAIGTLCICLGEPYSFSYTKKFKSEFWGKVIPCAIPCGVTFYVIRWHCMAQWNYKTLRKINEKWHWVALYGTVDWCGESDSNRHAF